MKKYGYVRVSSKDQNPDRQITAMLEAGIKRRDIYIDKMSGKNFLRPAYHELMLHLKRGDELYVKSIDRLGRNYQEILEEWRKIVKELETNIAVIDMPLLNTASENGDLTGVFLADLVLRSGDSLYCEKLVNYFNSHYYDKFQWNVYTQSSYLRQIFQSDCQPCFAQYRCYRQCIWYK